ncbi:Hypothetical predicted protein [Pelobates cultripes]|uniref:Uncharacterized protein n=1 Tax=Pelobates cultripes TaxID=61616 RepID=A0AAD1W8Z5_PELCU|nr:Hypothetical predicted protein [Pelobates cultripes]
MNLPNLKQYYHATVLSSIIQTRPGAQAPQWKHIEAEWANNISTDNLIWIPKLNRPHLQDCLPTTTLSLKIWDGVRPLLTNNSILSKAMPLKSIAHIIPDFNYRIWERHSIQFLHQILTNTGLATFASLQNSHKLPTVAHYSYRQLDSWLRIQIQEQTINIQAQKMTEFEEMYISPTPSQKIISSIYTTLPTKCKLHEHRFIKAWETETHKKFTEPEWEQLLPKPDRYLIFHINIVALGALAQNWLSQTIPSIPMCIQQISHAGHFESTMRRQTTSPNKPHKQYRRYWEIAWDKWETYKVTQQGTSHHELTSC